jgi:NADH dehydrogenase FAD-containing subunit
MGRHAGAQIVRLQGQAATVPFKYHGKGMATIGRRSAAVQLAQGPRLRGTLAWLSWPCTCSTCSAGATGCRR